MIKNSNMYRANGTFVYNKHSWAKRAQRRKKRKVKEHSSLKFIKRQLINSKGNICAICGEPITDMKDCTIDHIIPISKGGQTTIENCQLAHEKCNIEKGDS